MKDLVEKAQKIRFRVDHTLDNRKMPPLSPEKTAAADEMARRIKLPGMPKKSSR
jgi:hypothetical protein